MIKPPHPDIVKYPFDCHCRGFDMDRSRGLRLRHLELFHWTMVRGSITGAAEALGTSQPTVSRDLAELERLLGTRLFQREGRSIRPTREAEYLHGEVARNYLCADLLLDLSEQVVSGQAGRIRIASVPSMALGVVPAMIATLVRERPQSTVELQVHGRDTIFEMLAEHRFDVVFTVVGGTVPEGMDVELLGPARAVCVFHPDSPLAGLDVITPADLADSDFIALDPNYVSRQKIGEVFLKAGTTPRTFMTTQTAISACSVIRSGFGVTIIDPLTADFARDENLCVRRFEPVVTFDYIAAFPHRQVNRPLVEAAIRETRNGMTLLLERSEASGRASGESLP